MRRNRPTWRFPPPRRSLTAPSGDGGSWRGRRLLAGTEGTEVPSGAVVTEVQRRGNRLSPVREPGADGLRIDRLPDDVFVEKCARSQQAHIVEQGHRLGAVHFVAARIDDWDRTCN